MVCERVSLICKGHKFVQLFCDFLRSMCEMQTCGALCCRFLSFSSATLCSLLGVDKVIQYAVTEWLTDIRKNQLPGILGGVGPMHSVVQLCKLKLLSTQCQLR